MNMSAARPDAIVLVGFGGPESPEEIMPFLEEVTRGRPVPRERLEEVERHYLDLGGSSPIHRWTRLQAEALGTRLAEHGEAIPVVVGNRHWHPFVADVFRELRAKGARRIFTIAMAAYEGGASTDRYEEIARKANATLDEPLDLHWVRGMRNEIEFVEALADRTREAFLQIPESVRPEAGLVFTAHSIPVAATRNGPYVPQLMDTANAVARAVDHPAFVLAYQSKSGSGREPWLEPDISVALEDLARAGTKNVVVAPIGFLCDHVEVLYDLDREAQQTAKNSGISMIRAPTLGTHPKFIEALAKCVLRELAVSRAKESS